MVLCCHEEVTGAADMVPIGRDRVILLNVYAMPNCSKHTACSMLEKIVIMGTQLLLTPEKLLPKLIPTLLLVTCTLMAKM